MSAIRHQHRGGNPAIAESDLHIPLAADPGTGTFTVVFAAQGLCSGSDAGAAIGDPGLNVEILASVAPNRDVLVRLGRFGAPLRERVFHLPRGLDLRESHRLVVAFAEWWIVSATVDDQALAVR